MPHQCALQLTLKWLGAVQDKFPLRQVGVMTLNRNVDNWFNDNEVVAFNPGNMPPGLLASDDKLLQSRIFSYSDAQRYRCLHPRPPFRATTPAARLASVARLPSKRATERIEVWLSVLCYAGALLGLGRTCCGCMFRSID